MERSPEKILLGMLLSNGDCLMATVLARQIKIDFPGCHLTWAISDLCRQVILNHPDIDEIWEIRLSSKKAGLNEEWRRFREEALEKKQAGVFNRIFFTQVYPDNLHHFDGTTRGTIYNAYPLPVTVDARPILRLQNEEVEKLARFAADHGLKGYRDVILFECSAFSGQSFVTSDWAMAVATDLVQRFDKLCIILSTHENLVSPNPRIIIGNGLSLRENAELTKYCSLLIGCSSGITWMATSDWARPIPMIQFLNRGIGFSFASVAYDHAYWGLDSSRIIETTGKDRGQAVDLISFAMDNGIENARAKYHMQLKPRFVSMVKYSFMFFRKAKFGKAAAIIRQFIRRNYLRKSR